jgi:hypothetical protein
MKIIILLFCFIIILLGCDKEDNSIDSKETDLKYRGGIDIKIVDTESCMRWALGEDYGSLSRSELDYEWNKRHGEIFVIKGSDAYDKSIERIKNVCKENKFVVYLKDK